MDEAHLAVLDDDEGDVFVQPHDVDAMVFFPDVIDVFIVRNVGFYFVKFSVINECADDILRGLLGYADAVYFESGITHDGGDVVSAGYFSFPRNGGDAVEVPRMAQPAAHHRREAIF